MEQRNCFCGASISHLRKDAKWCSESCRHKYKRRSGHPGYQSNYAPRSAITIIECYVCGDLFVSRLSVRRAELQNVTACRKPACRTKWNTDRTRDAARRGLVTSVKKLVDRVCDYCGTAFRGRKDGNYDKRFCSDACRDAHWALKAVRVNGRKISYKGRKRMAFIEAVDRQAVFERDNWICHICGNPIDPNLKYPDHWSASTDHVIPLSGLQGTHEMANVRAAHKRCNELKSDKLVFGGHDEGSSAEA